MMLDVHRAVPTLLNAVSSLAASLLVFCKLANTSKHRFGILKGVSGILKPVRMHVVAQRHKHTHEEGIWPTSILT